jgi:murein L,D-transpeptidase YcbB/YkuD
MLTSAATPRVFKFAMVLMGIAVLSACSGEAERDATRQASAELQRTLAGRAPSYVMAHHDGAAIWKTLRKFYAERRYQPAWIEGTRLRPQLDSLLRALDGAGRDGLDPELYDLGPLSHVRSQARTHWIGADGFESDQVAPVDLRATAAWLAYASDLANGVTARPHNDPMWKIRPRSINLLPVLTKSLDENRIEEGLRELAPQNEEYRRLADAHERYRKIAEAGGWPKVPARLTLKPNQRSPHLATLAKRLAASEDLPEGADAPLTYDRRLQEAVRRFRARHGFVDSPTLTRDVVAAMNVPVSTRLRQIELNMERWRWFPRELGERHIRVNVPEYHLDVIESGRPVLSMRVVVGAREKATPIFSDSMTTIVFSPYWNVPSSIAMEETLPAIMEDPEFLAKNNIEVVSTSGEVLDPATIDWSSTQADDTEESEDEEAREDKEESEESMTPLPYRFRQRPGTTNSLGLVKFLFPNDFDVYLHDTPASALFARSFRALSHGCVRLEQPVKLAEYLLGHDSKWDNARIDQAMHAGKEQYVRLPKPVPVHLMYWTARVDDSGAVRFFDDIYKHDARQWADYQSRINRVKKQKERLRKAELKTLSKPGAGADSMPAAGGG